MCVFFLFICLDDMRRRGSLLCVEILMHHGPVSTHEYASIPNRTLIGRHSLYTPGDGTSNCLGFPHIGSLQQRVDSIRPREEVFSFHTLSIQAKNR